MPVPSTKNPIMIRSHNNRQRRFSTYQPNMYCSLQLSANPDQIFKVEIIKFRLEVKDLETDECIDYLKLTDGATNGDGEQRQEQKEMFKRCGNIGDEEKTWYTFTNNLDIVFSTDHKNQENGFEILITAMAKPSSKTSFHSGRSSFNFKVFRFLANRSIATSSHYQFFGVGATDVIFIVYQIVKIINFISKSFNPLFVK